MCDTAGHAKSAAFEGMTVARCLVALVVWGGCGERAPACGDGFVDPGEECDWGESNDDTGECKTSCMRMVCGDRLVQPTETCDDGNDSTSDGCAYCQRSGESVDALRIGSSALDGCADWLLGAAGDDLIVACRRGVAVVPIASGRPIVIFAAELWDRLSESIVSCVSTRTCCF